MKQFYDLQVQGQYRKSEAFIAEDTKDWFYTISKPRYKSFQVDHIEYNDDFTQAKAMVWVERYFNAPGFPPDMAVRGLTPSTWKLENGLWVWYEDQSAPIRLPWGDITPAPDAKAADGPAAPPAMPPGISGGPANLAALIGNKVKADQTSVTLKSGGSAQVTFANSALGPMTLRVDGQAYWRDGRAQSSDVSAARKADPDAPRRQGRQVGRGPRAHRADR